jgi:ribonuclease P protein component
MVMPRSGGRRLGVTVTSKIGCAVLRNRIKRVAREVFRRNRELFPNDCETVMVARFGAHGLGYRAVLSELQGAQIAFTEITRLTTPIAVGD